MVLPVNFNARALSPTVSITDLNDTEQFRFESESIDGPSAQQDFRLNNLGIHAGINDDHGYAYFIIEDSNNILTNTDLKRASSINRQWNIKVNLGKGVTGDRWFYGKVLSTGIVKPKTGEQWIKLICGGWGVRSMERISKIERIQQRLSNGLDFDPADTSTTVNSLVNDIWQDQDHYIVRSLGLEPGITLNIQSNATQMTEFKDFYQSWSFLMSRLAAVGSSVWGINADRQVFFRDPSTVSSGVLLSADESSVITQTWQPSKLCYISGPIEYSDNTGESGFSILHSPGATVDSIDTTVDPTINADFNLSSNWLAIEWTPTEDVLAKIAVKLKKVGTPADGDAFFRIVGADGSGDPNINDIRKRVRIPIQKLLSLASTNGAVVFNEFSFERIKVNPLDKLFSVFEKYGTGSHHFVAQYDSGGSLPYYTSSDGTSWTPATGDFALRTYPTRVINVILYNTKTARTYGIREKVVDLKNFTDNVALRTTLIGLSEVLGREKRLYNPLITSVPDNYIEPGQTLKIVDKFGLNTDAIIAGWDISMSAESPVEKIGASEMTWHLEEFI